MNEQEKLLIERLRQTCENVDELQKMFDIVEQVALEREKEIIGLKALCARAAQALEETTQEIYSGSEWYGSLKELIVELREAAE